MPSHNVLLDFTAVISLHTLLPVTTAKENATGSDLVSLVVSYKDFAGTILQTMGSAHDSLARWAKWCYSSHDGSEEGNTMGPRVYSAKFIYGAREKLPLQAILPPAARLGTQSKGARTPFHKDSWN